MRNFLLSFAFMLVALFAGVQVVGAQEIALSENFDGISSGIPTGWDNTVGSASNKWGYFATGYTGSCLRFDSYNNSTGQYNYLKTPSMDLSFGQWILKFKYKNPTGGDFSVYISTDGGSTYTTPLYTNLTGQASWTSMEMEITNVTTLTSNVKIVFKGTSNWGYGDAYIYLDDVSVEPVPTCQGPTGIYSSNLTTTSTDLNWQLTQEGAVPGSIQLVVADNGGNVIVTDTIPGTSISYALSGLTPNTTYNVAMRGDCNNTLSGLSVTSTYTFTTACNALPIPYSENFDGLTKVPDCTTSQNAAIDANNRYGTTGKSLKLTTTTTDNALIAFPILSHASNDVEVSLFMKGSSTYNSPSVQVGIVTDPGDIEGSFQPLVTEVVNYTSWNEIRFNTSAIDPTSITPTVMVAVFIGGGAASTVYIDNVSIYQLPSCIRPETLTASNPTANSIDLSWTVSTAAAHIVEITEVATSTVSEVTVNTNPCTVTGLQPNTQYSFRLRAYCGVGDTSAYTSSSIVAKTLCVPIDSAIWFENVESSTGSNLPDCWTYGFFNRTGTQTFDQPFVTQQSTKHSGNRAFQLKDMSAGNISYLTSPGFTIDSANIYQASIWVYRATGSTANEGLRIFASNSPDNVTGAQELGFISRCFSQAPVEAEAGWYQYTFPISVTGTVYLIIQGESQYGSATNFDDVSVELAPTCLPSGDIVLGTATTTDNSISWTAGPNNETSWVLAYELTSGSTAVASDSLVLTSPNYTFTGLSAATTYSLNARVYAICSPTDMAAAKRFRSSFNTPCGIITAFPYTQDFEGGVVPPNCWNYQVVSNKTGSYGGDCSTWSSTSSYKHAGSYGVSVSDAGIGAKSALVTGEMDFSNPNGYQVSFWMYRGSSYATKTDEAMHVFVHPTDSLDETTAVELGVVNQNYTNAPAEAAYGWYQYTFDVPANVTGTQHVSFCYHNQYGTGTYIDDVMIRVAPSCRDMANPVLSNIQPTSVDITVVNDSSDWDISYGPQGTAAGAGTIITVSDTNAYTLTGLTAGTTYDIYVRRNCGTEFGMWTLSPVSVTPACVDITATITDVDAYSLKVNTAVQNWEISYGPTGTLAGGGTIVTVSGADNYTLTGLTPATDYVVYVRNNCGAVYSDWSAAYTAKTTVVPDSIPFGTGFEDDTDNAQWTIAVGSSSSTFTFGTDANAVASGSKALYIQNGSSYGYNTSSSTATYAYRTIYFGSGIHNVSFRWKCTGGEGYYDYARIMLYPASVTIPTGSTGTTATSMTWPTGMIPFDPEGKTYITGEPGDANGWNTYSGDIDMTGREGVYNFVVMWRNDYSSGDQYPISIDNISISQVSCNKATVSSSATSSTGTTITAMSQTAANCEVVVSSTPIDVFSAVTGDIYQQVVATSTPVVLTGLTPNTPYYYTARAICGVGDTSNWADPQIVRTACDNYNVPYSEGFEDAGALNCWPSVGTVLPSRNTSYKYDGVASCKVKDATAVSPTLNVTTLASYMLNGMCRTEGTDTVTFNVGVYVDPEDPSTYEVMGVVTVPPGNNWTEFTTYFNLLNDPEYAAFYNAQHFAIAAGADATIYLDNLYLGNIPTCPKPTETAITNVLAHSFDLTWTENGTATSWRVMASPAVAGQATIDTVVSTNPATISGLNAASGYTIKIASICSATDTSLLAICGNITTACDVVNAPYSENFDNMTVDVVPNCWDNSASDASAHGYASLWCVFDAGAADGNVIRMWNYWAGSSSSTTYAIVETPVINLPTTTGYEFKFDYSHMASCGDLSLQISTDDGVNWTTLGSYSKVGTGSSVSSPGTWTTVSANLAAYSGNVKLRFSIAPNYGSGAVFVDNIRMAQLRSCSDIASINVNVGETTATVAFTDTASTHTEWQYVYGPVGFDPSTATPVNVTNDTIILTGLTASTSYDIAIRAYCGATEQSNWLTKTFKTTSAPAALPYVCHFDDPAENAQWQTRTLYSGGNQFAFGSAAAALNAGETAAMYISNDGTSYTYTVSNTSSVAAYRLFNFQATQYSLHFSWKCTGGESSYDYARFYLVPVSDPVFLPDPGDGSYTYVTWPSNIIPLDGDDQVNLQTSPEWNDVDRTLDMTNNPGSYYLVFVWANDYGYGTANYPLAVNDIEISELSCLAPADITVPDSTITETSVVVHYTDMNTAGTPVRYWVNTTGNRTDTLISGVTTASPFTISGLSGSSTYYLYMKAECTASDASPVATATFATACSIISTFPIVEGFEGTFPPHCWTNSNWSQYSPYYTPSDYVHSGNFSAATTGYGSSSLLTTPAIQFDSLREYNVSLWMYRSTSTYYTDAVRVYLSDSPNSTSGATQLISQTVGSASSYGMTQIACDIPAYTTGVKYIIFEGVYSYSGCYIDDIVIDIYPTCRDLSAAPTVDATTSTTMTVSVNKGPNHEGIIFAYAPSTATSVADTIGSVYSTTGTAVIQGLTANTLYKVFARGVCAGNDSTAWTASVTGSTTLTDCFAPQNVRVIVAPTDSDVTIAWGGAPEAIAYECQVVGTTFSDTVATDTIYVSGLVGNTTYTFRVRTFCATDTTAWSQVSFTTLPTPAVAPYVCDFENSVENAQWQLLGASQTNAFAIGSAISNGGANSLYISNDGGLANSYTISSTSNSYAVRLIYLTAGDYSYSYDWSNDGENNYDYGRVFLLNESSSPTAGSTPTGLSGYVLDGGSYLQDDINWPTMNGAFAIENDGLYKLTVYWHNDGSGGTQPPLAIDNFSMTREACSSPRFSVITDSTTQTSTYVAVRNPNESDTMIYSLSYGSREDAFLTDTIIGLDTFQIAGLTPATSYYLYMQSDCGAGVTSLWSYATFRTLCGTESIPYTQGFEELGTSFTGPGMIETICWNDINATSSGYPYYRGNTTATYVTEGTKSLQTYCSNNTDLYLMLPSFGNLTDCRVTFDCAVENTSVSGTWSFGYLTDPSSESSFVAVDTAVLSTNYTMTSFTVDVPYIPTGARLAFKYSSGTSSNYYGWLDNIRVFQIVNGPTYQDTLCNSDPYIAHGFNIPASGIQVGDNTFTTTISGAQGCPDTIVTANVYKYAKIQTVSYDTLCQGQPLVWHGYTIQNPTSRAYTLPAIPSVVTGCDSTVTLYLTVVPTMHNVDDTICRGDSYQFLDTTITTAGTYTKIVQSPYGCLDTTILNLAVVEVRDTLYEDVCKGTPYTWHGQQFTTTGTYYWQGIGVHGCPLDEVLYLNVIDGDSTAYVTICPGGSYIFSDTTITTAGTYVRSIWDVQLGCNITVTLHATMGTLVPSHTYDIACEGKPYSGFGISGLIVTHDTTVVITTTTIDAQCDSVSNVHLTFKATTYTTNTAQIVQGDVYRWNGEDLTEEGTYTRTYQSVEGCDSVVTLNLSYKGSGVDNVADVHMTIVPNPVNAGATTFVYGEFGEVENVEILNNFGQVIDRFSPAAYPIEVSGISASGLYYVRVTTKSGNVHLQKLIVK